MDFPAGPTIITTLAALLLITALVRRVSRR
jgi:hypothetical protein